MLISSIGQINDVQKSVTVPFKSSGDLIYIIGKTKDELGASAYYRLLAEEQRSSESYGGVVPKVDGDDALNRYKAMNKATELQLLNSSTTPTKGGVALSIALASMGGNCGADINLSKIHSDFTTALFQSQIVDF